MPTENNSELESTSKPELEHQRNYILEKLAEMIRKQKKTLINKVDDPED